MEYKIFYKIRQKIKIPYPLRIIFGVILIVFGITMFLVPPVPGFIFVITGVLFLIPAKKIKNIIKIRKGITHLFKNIKCSITWSRKIVDFFKHLKEIFSYNKKKFKKTISFLINLIVLLITTSLFLFGIEKYFESKIKAEIASNSAVNLPIFQKSEYRSWDMKPLSEAYQGFGNPTPKISINSHGLRDSEIPEEKTRNRVLLLGDSFVFGMGGYQDETISDFLNKRYFGEKYNRIINGGVIGHTIDDAFLYLKNDGIKFKPGYVVYNFFVGNDITELRRHKQTEDKEGNLIKTEDSKHYITESNLLRKKGKVGEIVSGKLKNEEPASYFLFWLKENFGEKKANPTLTWPVFFTDDDKRGDANLSKYWGKFFKYLKQMKKYCDERNIKFYVNIIPMDVQVSKKYWKKYPNMPFGEEEFLAKKPQKRIISLMKKEKIKYIDLLPSFQNISKRFGTDLYFEKDPHFNKMGNMWAASAIYLKLLKDMR